LPNDYETWRFKTFTWNNRLNNTICSLVSFGYLGLFEISKKMIVNMTKKNYFVDPTNTYTNADRFTLNKTSGSIYFPLQHDTRFIAIPWKLKGFG